MNERCQVIKIIWHSPAWLCSESESSNKAPVNSVPVSQYPRPHTAKVSTGRSRVSCPFSSGQSEIKHMQCHQLGETGILRWETGQMAVFGSIQAMFKRQVIFLFYIFIEVHKYELRRWLHSAWNRVKKNPETYEGIPGVWRLHGVYSALVAVLPLLSTVCGSCPW